MSTLEVTKSIEWDMGHRIPHHDGQCQYPHGHRYKLQVSLRGQVISEKGSCKEGMIIDFSDFKKVLKEKIHNVLDHRFLVAEEDLFLQEVFNQEARKKLKIVFVPFVPTSENIVSWCYEQIKDSFPSGLKISKLRLYETPESWTDFIIP